MKYLISFLSFFVFFISTPFFPLRNWDEAWYAEIIKNMANGQGTYLVPFWQGQNYFDKGPLYFWLSLPIVKIFGLDDWQVRFVSIIASAFCCLLIYFISNRLWENKNNKNVSSINVGLWAVIIFITLGQVFMRFSRGNIDSLLIALFLSTYYFWLKDKKWLSGITLGLGFLVKGWTLGLFPLYVIVLHSWLKDRQLFPKGLIYIIVGATLSSGWWYLLGTLTFGKDFYNWYVFTPAEGSLSLNQFSLEPFKYMVRDIGVWWVLVLLIILSHAKYLPQMWIKHRQAVRFLAVLGMTTLIFLSALCFAKEKLDWHNLPVYPFIAIIAGYYINLYRFRVKHGMTKNLILVAFCFLLVAQISIAYKIEHIFPDRSRVGAELGYMMTVVKNPDDIVILDDKDFTSFLYYSNVGKVYVVSQEGGKPGEYWTLKYSDLPQFIQNHKSVVLVSKNPKAIYPKDGDWLASGLGYHFVRY